MTDALKSLRQKVLDQWPGIILASAIAAIAVLLRLLPILSFLTPLSLAVLIGVVLGNVFGKSQRYHPGITFAARGLLRFAIVLLGFQLSVGQIMAIGFDGIFVVVTAVVLTFITTCGIASWFRVDTKLAQLIAAGTSICGASAVIAMNVCNESSKDDAVYAVGAVTLFGTLLMFFMPTAAHVIGMNSWDFGVWSGASIYEIAQVTGAAFQFSNEAGEVGVVVKLTRVLMLAPLIVACSCLLRARKFSSNTAGSSASAVPAFVLFFIAAVILNSLASISPDTRKYIMDLTTFLMSMALAAIGWQTQLSGIMAKGIGPLALGAFAAIFIVCVSFGLIGLARYVSANANGVEQSQTRCALA